MMTIKTTSCFRFIWFRGGFFSFVLVIFFLHGSAYADLSDGLVAHYKFDGNALDSSGNERHATPYNSPEYIDGQCEQAVFLQGGGHTGTAGDHYIIPTVPLNTYDQFTVSLWVRQDDDTGLYNHGDNYISFGVDGSSVTIGANNDCFVYGAGGVSLADYLDKSLHWGTWQHHCLTVSNSFLSAYRNGVLVGSTNGVVHGTMSSHAGIAIHWWSGGSGVSTRFTGAIDDVRVYDRTLTPFETSLLFSGQPDYISGDISYSGSQPGEIYVYAATNEVDFLSGDNQMLVAPESYAFLNLATNVQYWLRAFRDYNGNGSNEWWEARGEYTNNPVLLTNSALNVDIELVDYPDSDGDGIPTWQEVVNGTPYEPDFDSDDDGMLDQWEIQNGLNPYVNDALQDRDFDMVSNLDEYLNSTSPTNAYTHGGTNDYEWISGATNVIKRNYYDRNDRLVGQQYSKGFSFAYKYDANGNLIRKAKLGIDSDADGVLDLTEFINDSSWTNANNFALDSDGDGWTDGQELQEGSDPLNFESLPASAGPAGDAIQEIQWPFKPERIVIAAGNLNSLPGDEIVVSADGDVGDAESFIVLLIEDGSGWSRTDIPVGNAAVSSLAIGSVGSRSPAIYAGLRDYALGGSIVEVVQDGSGWSHSTIVKTDQPVAHVVDIRNNLNLIASVCPADTGVDGIYSITENGGNWYLKLLDDLTAGRAAGIVLETDLGAVGSIGAPVRLLDQGGVQVLNESGSGQLEETLLSSYPLDGHLFDLNERERHANGLNTAYCLDRAGMTDSACKFNGTDAYAEIAAYEELKWDLKTDNYSVSFWMRPDESGRQQTLLCDTTDDQARSFRIYIGADDIIKADVYDQRHDYLLAPLTGNTISTGQWVQVVFSVQDDTAFLYVDGEMVRSRKFYCTSTKNNRAIQIGRFNNTEYFNGALDDLNFYGRALENTEIATLSEHGSAPHGIILTEPQGNLLVYAGQCFADGSFGRNPVEQESSTNIVYHYVSSTGSNTAPYTNWVTAAHSIQSAINVADDGAVVLVTNGNYSAINVDKPIIIRSPEGRDVTTITGRSEMENGAVLDGFTVTGGSVKGRPAQGGGLYIYSYAEILNCIIRNNTAGGTYGDNNGSIYAYGGGIYCAGDILITNSIIRDNSATITAWDRDSQNSKGGGLYCTGKATLYDSQLINNTAYARGASNDSYDPDSEGGGLWAGSISLYNCVIQGNRSEATTSAEGEDADARGGGIYCGSGTLYNSEVKNNIVKAIAKSDDNQDADGYGGGIYGSVTYSNCLIQANSVEVRGEEGADGGGGGIYGSRSIGYDSEICDNTVSVYSDEKGASVEIGGVDNDVYRCRVINNHAKAYGETRARASAGGVEGRAYYSTIMNNSVLADTDTGYADADGGGVGSPARHCIIAGNRAIAETDRDSDYTAEARGGGVDGFVENCLVYNNYVDADGDRDSYAYGGGVCGGALNSTIIGNEAREDGRADALAGGIYYERERGIRNCIIRDNTIRYDNGNVVAGNYYAYLFNCCVSPVPSDGVSSNCFDADPIFVDPVSDNYQLSAGSPCIDAGYPYSLAPDDLAGNERIFGAVVDLGCYEFGSTPYEPPSSPVASSEDPTTVADVSAQSILYAYVSDDNGSSSTDSGDLFMLAEYVTGAQAWNRLDSEPYYLNGNRLSLNCALASFPSYAGQDKLLVGTPDGTVLEYASTQSESNLSWSVFSEYYKGKAWHGFKELLTLNQRDGIVGVVSGIDSLETCRVVLWDAELSVATQLVADDVQNQSPPAVILLSPESGTEEAVAEINIRLWDSESNPCAVQMQYRVFGAEDWNQGSLRSVDGTPYYGGRNISSSPTGADHGVMWAASEAFGTNFTGQIEIRMLAEDVSSCGQWSTPVVYELDARIAIGLPSIEITTPDQSIEYQFSSIILNGIANSNAVGNISVENTRNGWKGSCLASDSWALASVQVEPGTNAISASCVNAQGFHVSDSLIIYRKRYNTVPPEITVTNVVLGSSTQILLQGTASQNLVGMMEYDQITVGFTTSNTAVSVWQSPGLPFVSGANTISITAFNQYGLTGSVNFVWQTDSDDDDDGIDNQSELISGTDFADSHSYFFVESSLDEIDGNSFFVVEWESKLNRLYDVEYCENLVSNGWNSLINDLLGTGADIAITDTNSVLHRVYRVKVRIQE